MKHKPIYICAKPFEWFEIIKNGDVFLCCPTWLNQPVGNIFKQSIPEIWMSQPAKLIRQSVTDQSFRFCNKSICANYVNKDGPVKLIHTPSKLPHLPPGPRTINCQFDQSCNLACPTCRKRQIIFTGKRGEQVESIIAQINDEASPEVIELYITGSGDPFGSPYFFNWLRHFPTKLYSKLTNIHLHTNAQLFTPKSWNMIKAAQPFIHTVEISIDAATASTYATNRRGGDFQRLLHNLNFISSLRQQHQLCHVTIDFVAQANNYQEIPAFIRLREKFHFDTAYVSQLINWGTFTESEYFARAIHLPTHPEYDRFVQIMKSIDFNPQKCPGNRTNITFDHQLVTNKSYLYYVSRKQFWLKTQIKQLLRYLNLYDR